ncbi:MAG: efflux RND transporter permease subunit [Gemmataceae bacterium]
MLNAAIRWSLRHRGLIVLGSIVLLLYGTYLSTQLPIDVLPDLDRPRVVILTECPGLAAEEVETLVAQPIETALLGAAGVQAVRSQSASGLNVVYVEFDWDVAVQGTADRARTAFRRGWSASRRNSAADDANKFDSGTDCFCRAFPTKGPERRRISAVDEGHCGRAHPGNQGRPQGPSVSSWGSSSAKHLGRTHDRSRAVGPTMADLAAPKPHRTPSSASPSAERFTMRRFLL